VEATLLLVDHARLEDQVLVLVVEAQALLEGSQGLVVLLGSEVGGAEVEEKLGTLRLEIDRLLEKTNSFFVMLGAPLQEGELHPCIDGAWIGGEDLLELDLRLGVAVGGHEGGGQGIARAELGRLDAPRVLEGGPRA